MKKYKKILIVFCFLIFLIFLIPSPQSSHDATTAYIMAQDFIESESRLISPGTTKWPSHNSNDVNLKYLGNGKYSISAYVDSQNVFGALIRKKFICIIQYVGDSNWRLESLIFDE